MKHAAHRLKIAGFCCVSFTLLALNFYTNFTASADPAAFASFVRYSERSIIGRLIKSRQDGIFSAGGLSVYAVTEETAENDFAGLYYDRLDNTDLYLNNKRADFFSPPYLSQICGQGMLYSILDRILPVPQSLKLHVFHALSSGLTALALTVVLAWFYAELGPVAGCAVLVSALMSAWLTVFGRDLWWSTWAFYVPPAMVMLYFLCFKKQACSRFRGFGLVVFFSLFFKTVFNGYEYMTTILVMMMVPFAYYCLRDRIALEQLLRGLGKAALGTGLALAASLGILSLQIASVSGQASGGLMHVLQTFQKRSHAEAGQFQPVYAESLKSATLPVVLSYLKGNFLAVSPTTKGGGPSGASAGFSLSYGRLVAIFALMSMGLYLYARTGPVGIHSRSLFALILATWFSILAPLSWFIIFKSHSYAHRHLNFIIWQMPFTFFGAAVTGLACSSFWGILRRFYGRRVSVMSRHTRP